MKSVHGICLLVILCAITIASAGDSIKPAAQKLWPGGAPGALGKGDTDEPSVIPYLPPADKANGAAIVICPGGGYGMLAMDHEGHQIARWANSFGVAGIIVRYRLGPRYHHPIELGDVQRALRYTRAHAKEWNIDPKRVGVLGFSAGGHLASTAGTHFDYGKKDTDDANRKDSDDAIDRQSCRPDFMILLYPVITFKGPFAHMGSRENLLGKDADDKLVESLCNEKQVTAQTPPTFLVHTSEDRGVPPENSVMFYRALQKARVPAELHIYEKGQHGLGLGPKNLPFSSWPDRCVAWLNSRGLLSKK
jgi:acetyl esterase/lipase